MNIFYFVVCQIMWLSFMSGKVESSDIRLVFQAAAVCTQPADDLLRGPQVVTDTLLNWGVIWSLFSFKLFRIDLTPDQTFRSSAYCPEVTADTLTHQHWSQVSLSSHLKVTEAPLATTFDLWLTALCCPAQEDRTSTRTCRTNKTNKQSAHGGGSVWKQSQVRTRSEVNISFIFKMFEIIRIFCVVQWNRCTVKLCIICIKMYLILNWRTAGPRMLPWGTPSSVSLLHLYVC